MRKMHFTLWLSSCLLVLVSQLFGGQAQAPSQYPIVDKIADKVIQKYQNTSCDDLKAKKQQPPSAPSPMEQKAVEELKNNPDMRQHFLDKVAGPIANKMFECGMVP